MIAAELEYSKSDSRLLGGEGCLREVIHPQRGKLLRYFPDEKSTEKAAMDRFYSAQKEVDKLSADRRHYIREWIDV